MAASTIANSTKLTYIWRSELRRGNLSSRSSKWTARCETRLKGYEFRATTTASYKLQGICGRTQKEQNELAFCAVAAAKRVTRKYFRIQEFFLQKIHIQHGLAWLLNLLQDFHVLVGLVSFLSSSERGLRVPCHCQRQHLLQWRINKYVLLAGSRNKRERRNGICTASTARQGATTRSVLLWIFGEKTSTSTLFSLLLLFRLWIVNLNLDLISFHLSIIMYVNATRRSVLLVD